MKQFCYISQRRSILFYFIFFLSYKTNSVNLFPKEEIKKQKPSKPFPFIFFFDKSFRKFRNNKRFIFCFALKKEYLQIIININMHNNRLSVKRFQANTSFVEINVEVVTVIQVDSQSILPLHARELITALSGPMQLPVCNYRRETRAKWVLNEKLSTLAARLQWNFRLDGKCNPLSFAEVASFPRSYEHSSPTKILRLLFHPRRVGFKDGNMVFSSRLTPAIFIFSKYPLLFQRSWNILTNFLGRFETFPSGIRYSIQVG